MKISVKNLNYEARIIARGEDIFNRDQNWRSDGKCVYVVEDVQKNMIIYPGMGVGCSAFIEYSRMLNHKDDPLTDLVSKDPDRYRFVMIAENLSIKEAHALEAFLLQYARRVGMKLNWKNAHLGEEKYVVNRTWEPLWYKKTKNLFKDDRYVQLIEEWDNSEAFEERRFSWTELINTLYK